MLSLGPNQGRRHYYLHLTGWENEVTKDRAPYFFIVDKGLRDYARQPGRCTEVEEGL